MRQSKGPMPERVRARTLFRCPKSTDLCNLGQFMVSGSVGQLQPLDETLDVTP